MSQTARVDRKWNLDFGGLREDGTTKYGIKVRLDRMYPNVLRSVSCFYICEKCGKIYWDNSQIELKIKDFLKDMIVED